MVVNQSNTQIILQIKKLLQDCEETSAVHIKNAHIIRKLLINHNEIMEDFFHQMKIVFIVDYKNADISVEKIIDFFGTLIRSFKPILEETGEVAEHPIFIDFFKFLVKCSKVKHEFARYWSCKLLDKIFDELNEISNTLFENVINAMLKRLDDPRATIRYYAVRVLHRLQDPNDKKDKIFLRFMKLISSEINTKVRELCLEKVAIQKSALPVIISRTKDVQENIRLTAHKKLEKCMKYLSIEQRRTVLKAGFNDNSEKVTGYVQNNILEYLLNEYDGNYIELLKAIRFDSCDEDVIETEILQEKILGAFFKSKTIKELMKVLKLNEKKFMNVDDLNWETASYYRIFVEYLRRKPEFEEQLTEILPDLIDYCVYIKQFVIFSKNNQLDFLEEQFILKQMFKVVVGYDTGDPTSHNALKSLIFNLLKTIDVNKYVAQTILKSLEQIIPKTNDLCLFMSEIISDIAYNLDCEYKEVYDEEIDQMQKSSQIRAEIMLIKQEELHYFKQKNYTKAEEMKLMLLAKNNELSAVEAVKSYDVLELSSDLGVIFRYLMLIEELLSSSRVKHFNPAVRMIKMNLIEPNLIHEDTEIKTKAIKCLGLCALLDESCAKHCINILSIPIMCYRDGEEISVEPLIVSISAVVDLLLLYGSRIVASPEENKAQEEEERVFTGGLSLSEIINGLLELLDDETPEIEEAACHGLCKLAVFNRLQSSTIFTRLILKWANPSTEDKIKQYIGGLLNQFPTSPCFFSLINEIFIKTINTKVYSRNDSIFSEINLEFLVRFMLSLINLNSKRIELQTQLAKRIYEEFEANERENGRVKKFEKLIPVFSKILTTLEIEQTDDVLIEDLVSWYESLDLENFSKRDKANIAKFIISLHNKRETAVTSSDTNTSNTEIIEVK